MIEFARMLIHRKITPQSIVGDALHVAIAVVAEVHYLLTWNVRHLANPNRIMHLSAVCGEHGYLMPKIVRPDDSREIVT